MLGSFVVFVLLAKNVRFEENLLKLFPDTEQARETSIAFGNLKVKDKVFVEIVSREGCKASPEILASAMDCFVDSLVSHDTDGYVDGCLWKFDQDMAMNALDYVLNNAATLVSEEFYPLIEEWIADGAKEEVPKAIQEMLTDYTGDFAMIDGYLFSPDSLSSVAFISPTFNSMDTKYASVLLKDMERETRFVEDQFPEVEVLYHGAAIEGAFNSRQIKSDLLLTICISIIVICLVIGLCFKNKSTLLLLLVPVIYGAVFSLAMITVIKGGMSLMAIGLGAVILGTALSYCLHVLTHYKYVSDPETVIREQSRPVCLGCLTTIGAFSGLLFTTSDLLKDFGIFASFALLGTTFFALVFLPHFFHPERNVRSEHAFAIADKFNSYRFDKNHPLAIVLGVIILISFIMAPKVFFDSDLYNIGFHNQKVEKSKKFYSDHLDGGKFCMYYSGTGETLDDAILSARNVTEVLDSLRNEGIVCSRGHLQELLVPEIEQQENIDRWKLYWEQRPGGIPANLPSIAYSLIEADYAPASLPEYGALPDEFLSNFVEQSSDGSWMVFVSARMDKSDAHRVNDCVAAIPGSVVIDPYYYTEDMLKIIHSDFNIVLWISSLFVLLVLLLSFRNIVISLIAFLPMFLSWYVVQGIMAIFGIEFNLFNIIISSFIFGVGVDYSIFVMDGLLDDACGRGRRLLLCHKAAILFSAFVLLTVMTSLLLASHPCISSIGDVTVIGMVSTLLITYTLEPLFFRTAMRVDRFKKCVIKK